MTQPPAGPPAGPPDGRVVRGLDGLQLAGADVVEVSPPYDRAELTSLAAANLTYEMLSLFAREAR